MSARLALAVAIGGVLLGTARPASAFCLTHGCNETTQSCQKDEKGCIVSGPLLFWKSSCVSFDVQQDGSALRGIEYGPARDAIRDAFSEWRGANCGGQRYPEITITDYGPVECRVAEYNQEGGNANVFMFRDDSWPYENSLDTLALTTLIFNAETGEIYDADVEINTFESAMSIAPAGSAIARGEIDFRSVITHEIGHFLGLSHSNEAGSTMRPSYAPGNIEMASIEGDDIDGICAALRPGRATPTDSCEPRHGFSSACGGVDDGCSTTPGHARGGAWLLGLALLSSSLLRRSRRAGQRRAVDPDPRLDPGSAS